MCSPVSTLVKKDPGEFKQLDLCQTESLLE